MNYNIERINVMRSFLSGSKLLVPLFIVITLGCTLDSRNRSPSTYGAVDRARLLNADEQPQWWMAHGRTYGEQRFSPLDEITTDNVSSLALSWHYRLDIDRATEATPIVVDGVMYVTGAFSIVYALDAVSGEKLWRYDPKVPPSKTRDGCCDAANRGVAVWKGRIYLGAYDGRLIALDAESGEVIWEVDTVIDHSRSYTITGAPRIVKGKVLIGNGGAELGVRGYVSAYDAVSGDLVWRFFTVPGKPDNPPESDAMAMARKTWTGDNYWKFGGGGTVWDSMAYDPELDLLYIGTGNGSPWNRHIRSPDGGDNLFLSSIVALDPDTGEYQWHYQTTPGETWDYTATQHMILAELTIDGRQRRVLMQAPKNGFFYVLDRKTGELISAEKFAPANWATHVDMESGRPVENPEADWGKEARVVSPGALGGHNWQPMSYSPQTGLVYIPMHEAIAAYVPVQDQEYRGKGSWHLGTAPLAMPEAPAEVEDLQSAFKGHLVAWDPVQQKEVWRQSYATAWNGGTLATAGGVVFQGTADGRFVAYDAKTGDKLWEQRANTGVMAGPISYKVDGEQYVSVAAGWGGAFPLALAAASLTANVYPEARILTYKLKGAAELPPPDNRLTPIPQPPELIAGPEILKKGVDLYNSHCGMCHGPNAIGNTVLPDLRYMNKETHELFPAILGGIYADRGMPPMMDKLSAEDVEAIHQYLIKRAHDLTDGVKQAENVLR